MKVLHFVGILLALATISCQRSAQPTETTSPIDNKSGAMDARLQPPVARETCSPSNNKCRAKDGTITVTIDGREATPEEQEVFSALGRKLLSDAVHKALNKVCQEIFKKLDITDPIEAKLFSGSFGPFGPETGKGDQLWSVHMIRSGKEDKDPHTIVLYSDGKPCLRFTRSAGPVERPVAIMSVTTLKDGSLAQAEMVLVYGSDGNWKQHRPRERKESLSGDKN